MILYGVQGVPPRTKQVIGDRKYGHWRQQWTLDIGCRSEQWTLETAMANGHWSQKLTLDIGIGDSNEQRTLCIGHWGQK